MCVYSSDTAFAQHLLSLEMRRRAGLLGIAATKAGVRGRGTKNAPLSVQSPRSKRLHLGSSGEIQVTATPSKSRDVPTQETPVVLQNSRFDTEVDVTGSEITTVGDTSFIVEDGVVSILR
ncbi:uncharacterized protein [Montipora foliosa]|uniref:uncharacterized protein n=1 Tax=Montipora foliosa TaxID=591990 RepID=UPI0035F1B966